MNGGNLFSVLLSTIRSRFSAITSKVRLWTSWNFIQSRIITRIRQFFTKLFDVKPKNKDDYYTFFGWMISKKLARSIIILLGVVSIWYIVSVKQVFAGMGSNGGIRTYSYDSLQLRLAKDQVRILGKSGYLAYEGQVAKGYVTGVGTLYTPDGAVLYNGNFTKNLFEGAGKLYFPSGAVHYEGNFHNNLYDGAGKLYRESGSILYDGNFVRGQKSGEGKLFGENSSLVYEGQFAADDIVYASFLGKSTAEARDSYQGGRRVWQGTDMYCVYMNDIGAMYTGKADANNLNDEVMIDSVYVISDSFPLGVGRTDELKDIRSFFGDPIYEGNSAAILPEAVVINILNETHPSFNGKVEMRSSKPFSDVTIVDAVDENYSVYLTSFENNGLIYTFVSEGRDGKFEFYCISAAGDSVG
ncbi:MAG: hypothetical protein K5697_15340 [Lachnospiraceae bacterium]|nr:hypothetical protein [Lachnospiraceae bacterium]